MRKLEKPILSLEQIITDCVSNMQSNNDQKYLDATPQIIEYSNDFDEKMNTTSAYLLSPHIKITDQLYKEDMVKLYNDKFSKEGQPGRKYYDRLIITPKNGTCPICGFGQVTTLDHYMAKALYPSLAVTPQNLIPSCFDCNKSKRNNDFNDITDMTLHPYYDEVQSFEWLLATVVSTDPICIEYSVDPNIEMSPLRQRLERHLTSFKLKNRYSKKAAEELTSMRAVFQMLIDIGGKENLRDFINTTYQGLCKEEKNSWRTALYKAMIDIDKIIVDGKIAITPPQNE